MLRIASFLFGPVWIGLLGLTSCIAVAHEDGSDYETVVEVIALEHASAAEVVEVLGQLPVNHNDPHHRIAPDLVADERTNSVVLKGPRREVEHMADAVRDLDREM